MKCKYCDFINPSEFTYCVRCNRRLVLVQNTKANAALVEPYLPPHILGKMLIGEGRIEGERKNITVLFADISGFTMLTERLDPEIVVDFLNDIYNHLIQIVYRYNGIVDKIIGDELMVLFGAPNAHEDDPVAAVNTAKDLLNELIRYKRSSSYKKFTEKNKEILQNSFSLSLHCGIENGLGIIGEIGTKQKASYTVIGDMVNTAKRLCQEAKPNQILIGPNLAKLVRSKIPLVKGSTIQFKGKSSGTQVYYLGKVEEIEEKPAQQIAQQVSQPVAPVIKPIQGFIGRKKELEVLQKRLKQTTSSKKGGVIMLIGEPGIGKSRLVRELISTAPNSVLSLEGQAFSYLQRNKYGVFIDMLRKYFNVSADESMMHIRDKIKKNIEPMLADSDKNLIKDLSLLFSSRQEDIEGPMDSLSKKGRVFYATERFFQIISSKKPIIAVFEDIHWLDKSLRRAA